MITLNDYLYSGDTVLRILKKYIADLRISAVQKHNEVDLVHCNFLIQIMKLLEHNDFLTSQSQKIREFYKYMAQEYYKCNFDSCRIYITFVMHIYLLLSRDELSR